MFPGHPPHRTLEDVERGRADQKQRIAARRVARDTEMRQHRFPGTPTFRSRTEVERGREQLKTRVEARKARREALDRGRHARRAGPRLPRAVDSVQAPSLAQGKQQASEARQERAERELRAGRVAHLEAMWKKKSEGRAKLHLSLSATFAHKQQKRRAQTTFIRVWKLSLGWLFFVSEILLENAATFFGVCFVFFGVHRQIVLLFPQELVVSAAGQMFRFTCGAVPFQGDADISVRDGDGRSGFHGTARDVLRNVRRCGTKDESELIRSALLEAPPSLTFWLDASLYIKCPTDEAGADRGYMQRWTDPSATPMAVAPAQFPDDVLHEILCWGSSEVIQNSCRKTVRTFGVYQCVDCASGSLSAYPQARTLSINNDSGKRVEGDHFQRAIYSMVNLRTLHIQCAIDMAGLIYSCRATLTRLSLRPTVDDMGMLLLFHQDDLKSLNLTDFNGSCGPGLLPNLEHITAPPNALPVLVAGRPVKRVTFRYKPSAYDECPIVALDFIPLSTAGVVRVDLQLSQFLDSPSDLKRFLPQVKQLTVTQDCSWGQRLYAPMNWDELAEEFVDAVCEIPTLRHLAIRTWYGEHQARSIRDKLYQSCTADRLKVFIFHGRYECFSWAKVLRDPEYRDKRGAISGACPAFEAKIAVDGEEELIYIFAFLVGGLESAADVHSNRIRGWGLLASLTDGGHGGGQVQGVDAEGCRTGDHQMGLCSLSGSVPCHEPVREEGASKSGVVVHVRRGGAGAAGGCGGRVRRAGAAGRGGEWGRAKSIVRPATTEGGQVQQGGEVEYWNGGILESEDLGSTATRQPVQTPGRRATPPLDSVPHPAHALPPASPYKRQGAAQRRRWIADALPPATPYERQGAAQRRR
ncbi:hypothetical protein DFH06DRAFT_1147122 [Mycena polygramma]|nr:hypothetical protein DFH06DRAFT_1147122 [Mycena polygramma]